MKNKALIIILVVIIIALLATVGVFVFKLYNKDTENEKIGEKNLETSVPEEIIKERELSKKELEEIDDYLQNGKIFFLATEYEKPEEANLYYQIHYGFDDELKKETMTKEEIISVGIDEEILELTTVSKIKAKDMEEYIKDNLGISMKAWKEKDSSDITYSSDYDIYYYYEPTDAYPPYSELISGKINKDGQYLIDYIDGYNYTWTVTLEKNDDRYVFVSNINSAKEKIDEIKAMTNLDTKTVNYNVNYDCKLYYKNDTLYYAELINANTEEMGELAGKTDAYYYFDNNKFLASIYKYDTEVYSSDFCSEQIQEIFDSIIKQ